jgi:hypothetical protein
LAVAKLFAVFTIFANLFFFFFLSHATSFIALCFSLFFHFSLFFFIVINLRGVFSLRNPPVSAFIPAKNLTVQLRSVKSDIGTISVHQYPESDTAHNSKKSETELKATRV